MRKSWGNRVAILGMKCGNLVSLFADVKTTLHFCVQKKGFSVTFPVAFPKLSILNFNEIQPVNRLFIPIIHNTYNKLQLNKLTLLLIAGV